VGKGAAFLRFVICLILGFLPSFIFVILLVQSGSPFTNYINFLKDFNSSWWAWACAGGLIIFLYLFWSSIIYLKNPENKGGRKVTLTIFVFICAIILFLILTQVYLYGQFFLGSDLLIKLSSDKDNLFFSENQAQDVTFKISATMNPFCVAECNYEFVDLSSGNLIETGNFNIVSIFLKLKTYSFNRTETNESQKLARFYIRCKTEEARFCYTKSKEIERSILITLNYGLNEEEKKIMDASKEKIIDLKKTSLLIEQNLNESNLNIIGINNFFSTKNSLDEFSNLQKKVLISNNSIINLEGLWKAKKITEIQEKINETEAMLQEINKSGTLLRENIFSDIYLYNSLIDNLTSTRVILNEISKLNLNNLFCEEFKEEVEKFNILVEEFANDSDLNKKEQDTIKLFAEIFLFYQGIEESEEICSLETPISEKNFSKINLIYLDKIVPEISLEESESICCFYGECESCCDKNCSNKNYPVIFLHGHSVNKALPADYSLDALAKIKERLFKEGYIDAGTLITSTEKEQPGLWGRVNFPVAVTASYFFDIYKTADGEETTIPSKTDSIDTYAIRLKDIIETIKYRTNKDKVIIVAHSMGGLVTRRYVQVFGDSNIEKAIFITIPNHGIDGKISDYCSILGEKSTCNDMNKDSIFINKLDNAPKPQFPITNIIGIGCDMGSETGDGIVKNSSQFLSYATNYYIGGKCNELNLDFLHSNIVNPEQYPEVYGIIKKTLNNSGL